MTLSHCRSRFFLAVFFIFLASQLVPAWERKRQQVSLWMQVYNLSLDQKTGRPAATVDLTESSDKMSSAGDQLTLQKRLPAMPAGNYQLTVRVNDLLSGQVISPMAAFVITQE